MYKSCIIVKLLKRHTSIGQLMLVAFLCCYTTVFSQTVQRPSIWVKPTDKAIILNKIKTNSEISDYYKNFTKRVENDLKAYQNNKETYLKKLPWNYNDVKPSDFPPLHTYVSFDGKERKQQNTLMHYLQTAIDCGVLYFLTDDEQYAEYSGSVLFNISKGLLALPAPKENHNAGWLYTKDHLREAREIGAQLPIIYDFVYQYLNNNGKVYDLGQTAMVPYNFEDGQKIFRTYVDLALERGIINCNWPILESPSLVGNILALDDENERNKLLPYFLTINTEHQDALQKIAEHYLEYNGDWPESINYSNGVNTFLTYLITLLTKNDPSLHLGQKYPQILEALPKPYYMTYPNKEETILFGDGHRKYSPNYHAYETAYYLSKLENQEKFVNIYGSLLNSNIAQGNYKRFQLGERSYGARFYNEPTKLLWFEPKIEGSVKDYPLPVTDELPFAGIVLQRNLSDNQNAEDDLMGFVGGGHYVHGHATGMFMELYGKGFVLGGKSGRSKYRTEIHENYYRLFASNNTVIVNGSSEGKGGWAGLEINTVEKIAVEPAPKTEAISPYNSFSITRFKDDKGDKTEALQERTLGIVRTSSKTGYYIDVFRSKSSLPNQYHDYIYHNIGESLRIASGKKALPLFSDKNRFLNSRDKPWTNNKKAKHPGWHYFESIETSKPTSNNITATFTANKLNPVPIRMTAFILGAEDMEYTSVLAPPTTEGPKPYKSDKTPTLVIRKKNEAWQNPFAIIYEPIKGNTGSITSVQEIKQADIFKGFVVNSSLENKRIKQYIIIQESKEITFISSDKKIEFTGSYAVITLDEKDNLSSVYVGEGSILKFEDISIISNSGQPTALFIDFQNTDLKVNTKNSITVKSNNSQAKVYN
ncbi:hypothetical protein [Maribacter stanieri]|uniref:hypothetical protein n=1 Tax=Maribacter stanieri TaxID=440514 RepID=UPI002493D8D6|nr:hypothetical protein [Maribacter stanieri]